MLQAMNTVWKILYIETGVMHAAIIVAATMAGKFT